MKKSIKISLLSIAVAILAAAAIGYYLYQKPVKNFAESKADIILKAPELFKEFESDEQAAIKKYVAEDKTIQVAGKILEIIQNDNGTATILLDVNNPEGDISCAIIKEEAPKAEKYSSGSDITIKGQATGWQELINKEVIMIRCGIVEEK